MNGPHGIASAAKPGQIVVEFGSHPVQLKKKYIAPLAERGAIFLDGEVGGTPGMVEARKGVIYLSGDAQACERLAPVVKALPRFRFFSVRSAPRPRSRPSTISWWAAHRRHRAGDCDRAARRCRCRPHDQGDRQWQRRLNAIRNSRALDGPAQVHAPAGVGPGSCALSRARQGIGRGGGCRRAAGRVPDRYFPSRAAREIGERDVASIIEIFEPEAKAKELRQQREVMQ